MTEPEELLRRASELANLLHEMVKTLQRASDRADALTVEIETTTWH